MPEDTPLKLVGIRLSLEEIDLLETVRQHVAKLAKNPDVHITQRAALVTALKFYVAEKTRREKADS